MTRPLESEVGPRRISADEITEGDFIASITPSPGHRAIVLSDAAGRQFHAFCAPCGARGARWTEKQQAQDEADRHNKEHEGDA